MGRFEMLNVFSGYERPKRVLGALAVVFALSANGAPCLWSEPSNLSRVSGNELGSRGHGNGKDKDKDNKDEARKDEGVGSGDVLGNVEEKPEKDFEKFHSKHLEIENGPLSKNSNKFGDKHVQRKHASDLSIQHGRKHPVDVPAPPQPSVLVPKPKKDKKDKKDKAQRTVALRGVSSEVEGFLGEALRASDEPVRATQTLILYDTTSEWGFLGEMYAQQTAHLVSRFSSWKALPVSRYTSGMINSYSALIYIGSTYDEPLSDAFLTDVRTTTRPVIWMYDNIWTLTASDPNWGTARGWMWTGFDISDIPSVEYKGVDLDRSLLNKAGIMGTTLYDPAKASVVATARRSDGTTLPWAVRSGNFTYITEIPFSYAGMTDRYLVFADMLFDVYAPATQPRQRALVRIEDVGPDADPAALRAIADVLSARKAPFSVAVYPTYMDPHGVFNDGVGIAFTLFQRPQVVSALKYMQSKGGTLLMHGYTHQFKSLLNPYSGVSGDDFEFYASHVDANDYVIYDGPVPGDSSSLAASRMQSSAAAFFFAGLGIPTIFEPPHYAASAADYKMINSYFGKRYDRGLYFPGIWSGKPDYTRPNGQFFPYPVKDIYGSRVIPENIGNIEPEPFNNHPARLPADLLLAADKNRVVRDGFASFFYHPYLGTDMLVEMVDGLQARGWAFVSAASTLN